ncbi:hypothetical protein GGF32_009877 [Allomyces javanicus]|nr:hypothetical protein GGF32_009877 [Allomyces javanicus]
MTKAVPTTATPARTTTAAARTVSAMAAAAPEPRRDLDPAAMATTDALDTAPPMPTTVLEIDPNWITFSTPPSPPTSNGSVPDPLAHLNAVLTITDPRGTAALQEATRWLTTEKQVIGLPTETVYGLAGDARSALAVSRIFAAKRRPSDNPLIVHVASLTMLEDLVGKAAITPVHQRVMAAYWPGPLTLLFPIRAGVLPPTVTAGQSTVAVRFPAHPVARALIAVSGCPLAAPSANASGRPSPTLASHVVRDLDGRIPLVLDAGQCACGLESTVLSVQDPARPVVLRPGGVTVEQLAATLGVDVACHSGHVADAATPAAPGMKYRHYSPRARVIVVENSTSSAVAAVCGRYARVGVLRTVSPVAVPGTVDFDARADPVKELFRALRWLDDQGVDAIVVEGMDDAHVGRAFMNRVRKAASEIVDARALTGAAAASSASSSAR